MRQYERSGVMVDQCTECRGIFLDREHTGHTGYGRGHHKRKKRRSFLEELFD